MMTVQEIESKLEYLERANQTSVEIPKLSEGILSIEKLCSKDGRKEQIARSLVLRATLDVYQNDIESAKTNYLKSRQIANELKLARIILDCDSGLAQIEFLSGNNKQAHINTISIHYNSLRIGYTFRIAYCKVLLGLISQSSDLEDEALSYFIDALQIASENGYKKLEATILFELSGLFLSKEQFGIAEKYARRAAEVSRSINHSSSTLKAEIRLASILLAKDNFKKASVLLATIKKRKQQLPPLAEGTLLLCEARVCWNHKDYPKAEKLYTEAHKIFTVVGRERLIANTYQQQCEMYLAKKEPVKAIKYAKLSLQHSDQSQDTFLIAESYKLLYRSQKSSGNVKQSLFYLEKYNKTLVSNDQALLQNRLEYIELKTEYDKSQVEINEERRQAEMLRLELVQKERELTEKTRHLIKQTESLAQFRDDLRAILRRTPGNDPFAKDIRERFKSFPEEQLNWLEFDKQFYSVHPDFLMNLKSAIPTLTRMEQKICTLLRLNLTSTDIAKLLFLSDRNIENHRYRIRKKLSLDTEASIHEFLAKF